LIERKPVFAVFNDERELHRLTPPTLEPKEGFELPTIIEIPSSLTHEGETRAESADPEGECPSCSK
jgi:hypothetical protein